MFKMFKTTVWKLLWSIWFKEQDWINAWFLLITLSILTQKTETNQETPHLRLIESISITYLFLLVSPLTCRSPERLSTTGSSLSFLFTSSFAGVEKSNIFVFRFIMKSNSSRGNPLVIVPQRYHKDWALVLLKCTGWQSLGSWAAGDVACLLCLDVEMSF